jgi:hypothetical protein
MVAINAAALADLRRRYASPMPDLCPWCNAPMYRGSVWNGGRTETWYCAAIHQHGFSVERDPDAADPDPAVIALIDAYEARGDQ